MTWTRSIPVLTVVAALVLAGCGGSSKTSSSSSTAASASTPASTTGSSSSGFDNQLSALCVKANHAYSSASGVKAQAAVVAHYVPVFRSLTPPAHLRALYAHYVAVLALEARALQQRNAAQLNQLVSTQAHPLAVKLGARGCIG